VLLNKIGAKVLIFTEFIFAKSNFFKIKNPAF